MSCQFVAADVCVINSVRNSKRMIKLAQTIHSFISESDTSFNWKEQMSFSFLLSPLNGD